MIKLSLAFSYVTLLQVFDFKANKKGRLAALHAVSKIKQISNINI